MKLGLEDLPPFTFAGLRFAIAALPLAVLMALGRRPVPHLGDWWLIAWTGLLTFSASYGLVFWGQQYISSGLAALLFATFPLFGMLLAHRALPAERMTVARAAGIFLAIAGVGVVFSKQLGGQGMLALWGSVAVLLGAAAAAYADVAVKHGGGHLDPVVLTLGQMVAGTPPLLMVGYAVEGSAAAFPWTVRAAIALLYLSIVASALAFVLLYWLIQRMDVTKTMVITLVTPLIAVLLGVLVLREALTWRIVVGGTAILGGVALTAWSPPQPSTGSAHQRA